MPPAPQSLFVTHTGGACPLHPNHYLHHTLEGHAPFTRITIYTTHWRGMPPSPQSLFTPHTVGACPPAPQSLFTTHCRGMPPAPQSLFTPHTVGACPPAPQSLFCTTNSTFQNHTAIELQRQSVGLRTDAVFSVGRERNLWSRELLQERAHSQRVKKFHAFHGTTMFMTVSKTARHLFLSTAR